MTPINENSETGIAAPLQPHEQTALDTGTSGARKALEEDGYCVAALLAFLPCGSYDFLNVAGAPKEVIGRLFAEASKEAAVVLVCEAWLSRMTRAKDSAIGKAILSGEDVVAVPPRQDPNRKEVVLVQLRSGKRAIVRSAVITRPPNGKGKPTLGHWRTMDNAHKDCELRPASFESGGFLASGGVP